MPEALGITLDETALQRLRALGKLRNRSLHWLIKAAIESYLAREERYECEKQEDMERWVHYQLTGKALSQERVTAWLSDLAQGKDGLFMV